MGAAVTITITNSSQKVHVTSHKAFGSTVGANGLDLAIGYIAVGSTAAPAEVGQGIFGNRVAANTQVIMGMSGVITGLAPGNYHGGLIGKSTNAANWNSNEYSYTTAVVY